jgi:hypothetical protein
MLGLILVKKPFKNDGFDIYIKNISYKSTNIRLKMKSVYLLSQYYGMMNEARLTVFIWMTIVISQVIK